MKFLFSSHFTVALTEENLLFLEAWRTIDRAYIDKTFNGQSWFRYREDALRNEPMNTRQETCKSCPFFGWSVSDYLHEVLQNTRGRNDLLCICV